MAMNKKDVENRQRILLQQLELMQLFQNELIRDFGRRVYQEKLNAILDEFIRNRKFLQSFENQ